MANAWHLAPQLRHLDRFGPAPHAFTFEARYPAPGFAAPPVDVQPGPRCFGTA